MLNSDCAGRRCMNGICEGSEMAGSGAPPKMASASCLENLGNDDCSQCACTKCEKTSENCWYSGEAQRNTQCKAVMECVLAESCINAMDCQPATAAPMPAMPGGAFPGLGGGMPASTTATYGCVGRECYCGTNSSCTAPNGPCVRQIQAAAGNSSMTTVVTMRRDDPMYAAHYAEDHAKCLQMNCRTECGL
jgi:hypothetical protein